jgi:protein ImuB
MSSRRRFCRPPSLQDALSLPRQVAAGAEATTMLHAPPGLPHPAVSGRRILALHLPWLATERLRLDQMQPAACWEAQGSRRVLTAVTRGAVAAGLVPGQAVADAQAILPALALIPADAAADLAWLHRLALWAHCLTPLPAADPPDGLLLDMTGIAHLHASHPGGPSGEVEEAALLRRVQARLGRAGVTAAGAIAGNPVAAMALARSGAASAPGAIVPTGAEAEAMQDLPLAALRLPPEQAQALHRLGVRQVGALLALPRGPLARRFGAALMDTLDVAAGRRAVPIRPLRPPREFAAHRDFLEPIQTREAIDATLGRLLAALCAQLAAAGQGARRLDLLAFRVDGEVQEVRAESGLAQRDPRHFARLFRDRLERLAPGFGFERLALEAMATEPLGAAQAALPGRDGQDKAGQEAAFAQLLDRLSQRLPVWRAAPRLSHWPERAVARVGPFEAVPVPEGWPGAAPRPLRLLRRPVPLQAVALLPDAPPSLLRAGRTAWRVTRAEGPERIEREWWRGAAPADAPPRDYYRVELATGARLWVCRLGLETPRWWLHGRLP